MLGSLCKRDDECTATVVANGMCVCVLFCQRCLRWQVRVRSRASSDGGTVFLSGFCSLSLLTRDAPLLAHQESKRVSVASRRALFRQWGYFWNISRPVRAREVKLARRRRRFVTPSLASCVSVRAARFYLRKVRPISSPRASWRRFGSAMCLAARRMSPRAPSSLFSSRDTRSRMLWHIMPNGERHADRRDSPSDRVERTPAVRASSHLTRSVAGGRPRA